MATILQLRRGTSVQHSTFTGAIGEVTVDTTKQTIVVHDGQTAGGSPLATESWVSTQIQAKDSLSELSGTTDDLTEGTTNRFFSDVLARAAISVTDNGGDGSLTYSNGVITYTGPSAAQVRAHFTAGTGITYDNAAGEFAIDTDTVATQAWVTTQIETKDSLGELSGTTDDITQGTNNLFFSTDLARAAISVTGAGTYDSATGVINITGGAVVLDTDDVAEGTTNKYFTDARVKTVLASLDADIIPSDDNIYSLGSPTKMWKDVYVGPGSLYINGQKVLEENSGNIIVSADPGQNLVINTSGSGDIELDPLGDGVVAIKGPLQLQAGQNITSSDGNAITFSSGVITDSITSKTTNGNLVLAGNGTGSVTVADNLNITGNLTISGTTTTVNSETISLADNIIDLNSNFTTGTPTENAGIKIKRGDEADVQIRWNETTDKWQYTNDGSAYYDIGAADISAFGITATVTELNYVDGVTSSIQTQLDGKAAASHTHTTSDITNLSSYTGFDARYYTETEADALLAGKADSSHTHVIGDVTGLQAALDGKADSSHTHAISDITNLQTSLDAKLNSSEYTASDVLTKVKTVDGAGSGLDADLLDGQHASHFATAADLASEASARTTGDSNTLTSANEYTDTAISNLVNGASAAFDTLKEIQDAMATDAELSAAISGLTIGDGTQTITAGDFITGGGSFSANQTTNTSVTISVDATSDNTASKVVARDASGNFAAGTITANLTGNVTGNASTATSAGKWTTARTITLDGDLTGSVSIDGSANVTLSAQVADDSHNHVISNVDGLQAALDAKLAASSYTAADVLTKIKTVDGAGSGLDADLLDGQSSAYYATAASVAANRIDIYDETGTLLN